MVREDIDRIIFESYRASIALPDRQGDGKQIRSIVLHPKGVRTPQLRIRNIAIPSPLGSRGPPQYIRDPNIAVDTQELILNVAEGGGTQTVGLPICNNHLSHGPKLSSTHDLCNAVLRQGVERKVDDHLGGCGEEAGAGQCTRTDRVVCLYLGIILRRGSKTRENGSYGVTAWHRSCQGKSHRVSGGV